MGSIYKITCTVNDLAYIGLTRHDAENTRVKDHLNGRGNQPLKDDVKIYGHKAFTFEILEDGIIPEFLPEREKYWIAKFDTFHNGYNLTTGGEKSKEYSAETCRKISEANSGENNPHYGKTLSAETKRKISESNSGENSPHYGKTLSDEHRRKISEAIKGRKLSDEHRRKVSEANKGKTHSVESRQKMSEARKGKGGRAGEKHHFYGKQPHNYGERHPCYQSAKDMFFSLPTNMPLTEKRKKLIEAFTEVSKTTIRKWIRKDWITL